MSNDVFNLNVLFKICCLPKTDYSVDAIEGAIKYLIKSPNIQHISTLFLKKIDNKESINPELISQLKIIAIQVVANYLEKRAIVHSLGRAIEDKLSNWNVILLKAMAFNDNIYGTSSPRGSSDIDILVEKDNLINLEEILKKLGFCKQVSGINPFSGVYENCWSKGKIYLDIHTSLINPYKYTLNTERLFENSAPHPFYKMDNIRVLGDEDNLLHLALHFQKDCYIYHHSIIDAMHIRHSSKISAKKLTKEICITFNDITNHIIKNSPLSVTSNILVNLLPLCKPEKKNIKFKFNQLLMDFITLKPKAKFFIYYKIYITKLIRCKLKTI
jgi:hypothetical protein